MIRFVIKSDKEGYYGGPTGEPDGTIFFTKNPYQAEMYSSEYTALQEMKGLHESFNVYLATVNITIEDTERSAEKMFNKLGYKKVTEEEYYGKKLDPSPFSSEVAIYVQYDPKLDRKRVITFKATLKVNFYEEWWGTTATDFVLDKEELDAVNKQVEEIKTEQEVTAYGSFR